MQISTAAYKKDDTGMASIMKALSCCPRQVLHPDNLFLKLNANGLMKLLYQKSVFKDVCIQVSEHKTASRFDFG